MRMMLVAAVALFFFAGCIHLRAQTNAPSTSPQVSHENAALAFLTPEEQQKYARARAKALADNPALKEQGDALMKQGVAALSTDGTAAERQAFMEKMNSHRQKLRAAMLKEDPTLEPIFVKIDDNISELKAKARTRMRAQLSAQAATNAAPTNSAPAP